MAARYSVRRILGPLAAGVIGFAVCTALVSDISERKPTHRRPLQRTESTLRSTWRWLGTTFEHWREALTRPSTSPDDSPETDLPPPDRAAALGRDLSGLYEALPLYKAGDLARGDAAAKNAHDPLVQTALEWVALRAAPHEAGFDRLAAFQKAHPDWPAIDWIRHRMEAALYFNKAPLPRAAAFFAASAPQTTPGTLAVARVLEAAGKPAEAGQLVRTIWRTTDLTAAFENKIRNDFPTYLEKADHRARADWLLAKGDIAAALRAAAFAGNDIAALIRLRIAASSDRATDKMFQAIPAALQSDPDYLLAKAQKLRHGEKFKEAAAVLAGVPRSPALAANGDDWWLERRLLAQKILDLGDNETAYRLCAEPSAVSFEARLDSQFYAGWIALRFLNDPVRAARHFSALAGLAETPISVARAAYWQGRTAEISNDADAFTQARHYYEKAAAETATYYGQLAREKLGLPRRVTLRKLANPARGDTRSEAVRTVELLFAIGENDLARTLAIEIAQHTNEQTQLAALVEVVAIERDARAALSVGKILGQRRLADDSLAFPTFGVPRFDPVDKSAGPAVVYAVARQESAFDPRAVSSAGAKGLMQMIDATAKRTAERAGLDFSPDKMSSDAVFNARLGAAHLGQLLNQQGGSYILTFAAYNAGGGRVKQWIDAYGDPRSPGVDPVDWVERIPFTETRNYVQRVMENLAMYQASLSDPPPRSLSAAADSRTRTAKQ